MNNPRGRISPALPSLVLLGQLVGCVGSIDHAPAPGEQDHDPGSPGASPAGARGGTTPPQGSGPAPAPAAFEPGPTTFRRLTLAQYRSSMQDLLGADITVSSNVSDVTKNLSSEFTTLASARGGFASDAMALQDSALAAVGLVFGNDARRKALVGCTPASGSDPCVRTFIAAFGKRAWRRPLGAAELNRYATVATSAATSVNDVWGGIGYAVAGLLQSPNFLYLTEIGEPDPANPRRVRLTGYEVASRISYGVIGSIPDAALLDAADRGALASPEGIGTQVRRLLGGAAPGRQGVARFFAEYFNLDALGGLGKDPKLFPMATGALAQAMRTEVEQVIEDLVFTRGADYRELFTGRSTFVNTDLAKLYGLPAPTGKGFTPITMPDGDRMGMLGFAAYLALNAGVKDGSPTLRGQFVRDRVLCQNVPPPPPNVDASLTPDTAATGQRTMRQRLEAHRRDPACASCHGLMDPVGLTLEHYDALGRYRATDNGLPIDVTGEMEGKSFEGLPGLARTLRAHPDVPTCLPRQMLRYFSGRLEVDGETPVLQSLATQFASSGDVKKLIADLASSDMFRFATAAN